MMAARSRQRIEHALETALFASRWLLAPFYLGLAISIAILLIKFVQELFALALKALTATEADAILGVLEAYSRRGPYELAAQGLAHRVLQYAVRIASTDTD